MRILKYLTRDIISHTFAVALVLFLVVFSGRFIRYLTEAAVGDIAGELLLPVMFYKLPSFFELILPLALFVGILLSIGRFYAESEMVVLKACGVSPGQLTLFVLIPALSIAVIVALLALWIAPDGSARAQALLDNPRSTEGLQMMAEGRFKKQRDGNYVSYAETIASDGTMRNVFIAERLSESEGGGLSITFAKEGAVVLDKDAGRRYLELRDGRRFVGRAGDLAFSATSFGRYGELIPERVGGIRQNLRIEAMPTLDLLESAMPAHIAALTWRLSLPVFVPIIAVIALALSRTDARRGRYARLAPALLLFLVYFLLMNQTRAEIEGGASPFIMVGVHVLFALLGSVLMWSTPLKNQLRRRA